MINVITDFESRANEVESYFSFIEKIDRRSAQLYFASNKTRKFQSVDGELMKILKANAFLILYNLIESAVSNALVAIYDDLKLKNISFNEVKATFKKVIIKNMKNANTDAFITGLTDLSIEIVHKSYTYDKGISGNLDARKFRELAEEYGFSTIVHRQAKGGHRLLTVKTNRNSLAHGDITFSECGRQYSIDQLIEIKKEVIIYVKGMLMNIKSYLDNQEYLN